MTLIPNPNPDHLAAVRLLIRVATWAVSMLVFFGITAFASASTIFSENFEGVFPSGHSWTVGYNGTGSDWTWDTTTKDSGITPHGGNYMAYCAASAGFVQGYENNMDAYMRRSIDLSGYSSVSLSFSYIIPSLGTGDRCSVYVDQVDTNHEIFFRTVAVTSWTSSTPPDFSAYAGGVHTLIFRFKSDTSSVGRGWFVDDIVVSGTPNTPTAPSNLVGLGTYNRAALAWIDNSATESGFYIERKTGTGGTYAQIETVAANSVSYADTTVSAETRYYYRIRAFNGSGASSYTNEVAIDIPSNRPTMPSNPNPADGAVLAAQPTRLDWADSIGPLASKYDVYVGLGNQPAVRVGTDLTSSEWTATNVYSATSFYWYVVAKNAYGSTQGPIWTYQAALPPSAHLNFPNGGETWVVGLPQTISADISSNVQDWELDVSTDGGASWNFVSSGSYSGSPVTASWTPSQTTNQGLARISAFSTAGNIEDRSDATFSVVTSVIETPTIVAPSPIFLNRQTVFSGSLSSAEVESKISTWQWSFSDGTSLSGKTVAKVFYAGSEASATLVITDSLGRSATRTVRFALRGNGSPAPQNTSTSLDPVNLATGNFVADARDLVIPGRGLPFVFERFYNSKAFALSDTTASPPTLGWGWSHTFEIHIEPALADGSRLVVFGDGHVEKYSLVGGGYAAESDVRNQLVANPDDTFTLTGKNQVKHTFASDAQAGRLTTISDRNSNTISVTYDEANHRIDFITDTVGRKIQFQYDTAGHLSALVDPIGRTVQYSVDSAHDLHSVTNPRGYVTTFTYDSYHQLLTGTDARSHVFVQNTYDNTTRTVTKQFDADGNETDFDYHFDASPTAYTIVTRKAIGDDEVTYHYHDAKLRLVKRTDGRGADYYESFEYDDATSNLLTHVDNNGNRTEYGYNGSGDVTQVASPDGGIVTTTYTAFHDPELRTIHKVAGDDGIKAFWEYDAKGNLSACTLPYDATNPTQYRRSQTVDAYGEIETSTDANGHTTTFYYDSSGNNWKTLNAAGHTTVREFDGISRKTSDTDGRGNKTAYALDENGNVDETTFADGTKVVQTFDENDNRTSIEDQLHRTTYFAYDNQDRLYRTTDANGNETILGFDQLGNRVSVEQPGQGLGPVTITLGYDLAGNQISETDQLGKTRTFISDKNGNVTSETDADGVTMSYEFDSMNRRTKVTDSAGHATVTTYNILGQITQIKDALQNLTNYTYNDAGQLATTTTVGADGNTTSAFSFGYDYEGNQTSSTHGGNKTRTATYTPVNQLDTATDENGKTESYAYDEAGNLKTFMNGAGEVLTYEYDALNRRTSTGFPTGVSTTFTYFDDGRMKSMIDGLGTTTWTYTALGQVETATDPFGQTLSFGYDPDGNRTSVGYPGTGKVVTYAYDQANRLKSMTDWNGRVTSRDYTDAGRPSAIYFPNGVNTALGYDALGRQNDIAHQKGTAAPFVHFGYGFDEVGNITSETVVHPLSPVALPQTNTYTHDDANQLLTIDGAATTHDDKGNLTFGKLSATSSTDGLTFDYQNRLTNAVIGGVTTANRYDGLGHRLETTQNGVTKRFVVDGTGALAQILAETDAAGSVSAYYLYFGGLSARVLPDGAVSYYHTDRSGNVSAMTDGSGSVIAAYRYDPFGVSLASSGSSQNPFRYLGGFGVYDNGDGTLFARARYYHPNLGRFLSRDPLFGDSKDGQSLNRYVYALNNPSGLIDPSGLKAVAAILAYFQAWTPQFGYQLSEFGIGFSAGYNFSLADQNLPQEGNLINRSIGNASGYVVGIFGLVESALEHAVIYADSKAVTTLAAENAGATFGRAASTDYTSTFFKANPTLEGQVVVHHAVEQQVLTRYPGVVSTAEIHSLENLRGIPNEINSNVHLSQIRREWNQFYREHPTATQEQLLQKVAEIDLKYGSQFNPPR